jgi:hypothetical protein
MGLLHGRAGRLTAKNGGFRPGQCADIEVVAHAVAEREWAAWDDSCARWPPGPDALAGPEPDVLH